MRRNENVGLLGQTTKSNSVASTTTQQQRKHGRTSSGSAYGSSSVDASFENHSYQSNALSSSPTSPVSPNRFPSYSNNDSRIGSYTYSSSPSSTSSHIGTIKSNYYQQAREQQKNPSSQSAQSWSIVDVISDMLRYIYTSLVPVTKGFGNASNATEFPQPELALDSETNRRFELFKQFAFVKYDMDNESHEKDLMALWNVCMNYKKKKNARVELSSRISPQWKELGFQGTNPATDFRGSGILGLDNLLYFSNKYPDRFNLMFTRTRQTPSAYPFVIAGLNVTMMLHDILGIGMNAKKCKNYAARKKFIELLVNEEGTPTTPTKTTGRRKKKSNKRIVDEEEDWGEWSSENDQTPKVKEANLLVFDDAEPQVSTKTTVKAPKKPIADTSTAVADASRLSKYILYHELYVVGFNLLDQQWYRMNASSYFNFPEVLEATRTQMEDIIDLKFETLWDIQAYNEKL